MDPLSITGTILALTAQCLSTAKALGDMRAKLQNVEVTIGAICSECTVISVSLTQIQNCVLNDPNALATHIQYRPELESTFDTALTGCKVVLSVLDNEVQKLYNPSDSILSRWNTKATYMWNETTMKELLQQLRGQQTALSLLIQCLQLESSSQLHTLLQNNNAMLVQLVTRTQSLRQEYPTLKAPRSIFDAGISDVGSIYSGVSKAAEATSFDFDELVLDSPVYRRAFVRAVPKTAPAQGQYAGEERENETYMQNSTLGPAHDPKHESQSTTPFDPAGESNRTPSDIKRNSNDISVSGRDHIKKSAFQKWQENEDDANTIQADENDTGIVHDTWRTMLDKWIFCEVSLLELLAEQAALEKVDLKLDRRDLKMLLKRKESVALELAQTITQVKVLKRNMGKRLSESETIEDKMPTHATSSAIFNGIHPQERLLCRARSVMSRSANFNTPENVKHYLAVMEEVTKYATPSWYSKQTGI